MRKMVLKNRLFEFIKLALLAPLMLIASVVMFHPARNGFRRRDIRISAKLLAASQADTNTVLQEFDTTLLGLNGEEVESRQEKYGFNDVARERNQSAAARLVVIIKNPLILLLSILGLVSFFIHDMPAALVIGILLGISIVLRFVQEINADRAAERLKAMVSTTATALRGKEKTEIPLRELVPGDIVLLAAGDMIPADVRLLFAKDLFVNRAALTGESLPA